MEVILSVVFTTCQKAKDEKFSESALSLRVLLLTHHDVFQYFIISLISLEWIMRRFAPLIVHLTL